MRNILLLTLFIFPFLGFSQQNYQLEQNIPVKIENAILNMPFAGGINAAQIQSMDLDGDGTEELVVWDINSRKVSAYKISGEAPTVLPEMAYFFPADVNGFLVLADFDGDGKKDLFTSTPFGIKVFKNITPAGGRYPQWEVAQNFIRLDNGSNLPANNLDIPLVMDLDNDGDLDIVTFNFATGDYLQLYLNTSMERKGIPDVDGFAFPENRWGNFEFCDCGSFSFGITCSGFPFGRVDNQPENQRIEHAGGHSMLFEDFNGDGVKDMLLGQDECNTLYYLTNKGTNISPIFNEFSTTVPQIGLLPEFPIFHAASLFDNHLLISSNSSAVAALYQADYSKNIYQYNLKGDQDLLTEDFLQKDMIDLGENSRPFFRGSIGSGELIVTSNSLENGKVIGRANLFSVGPEGWELLDQDYLNLSKFQLKDIQYHEYQNSMGENYFFFAGVDTVDFSLQKQIRFSRSTDFETAENLEVPIPGIQPMDHFEFFSYQNRDYMLLAKQTGELILYDINFSEGIMLGLNQIEYLGFSDNPANRNLSVHVIPGQSPALFAVDQRGILVFIEDFINRSERVEVQIELLENHTAQSRLGRNTWITHLPDPFGENIDLILGNTAGGIQVVKRTDSVQSPSDQEFLARVYPNPSPGPVKLIVSQSASGRLISSLGKVLLDDIVIPANMEIEIQTNILSPGLYIIQLTNENGQRISKKLIVSN